MEYSKKRVINKGIPDNDNNGLIDKINIGNDQIVESVSVNVNIAHPYAGDLRIELIGPDGTNKTLMEASRVPGKDLSQTFDGQDTDVFTGINSKGVWSLIVIDSGVRDSGQLIDWTLQLKLSDPDDTEIFIDDVSSIVSTQTCHQGGKIEELSAYVKVYHAHIGDLTMELISPSGRSVLLHNREGSSNVSIIKTFDNQFLKAFAGAPAKGLWKLKITDYLKGDTGRLMKWKLNIKTSDQ